MRAIGCLLGMVVSGALLGQGTVNLHNNFVVPGGTSPAYVLGLDCLPMAKAVGRVEVLDAQGGILTALGQPIGVPFGADGLFFLGVVEIPGTVHGGSGAITIRAWDVTTGQTYDAASVKGSVVVTLHGLGGGLMPPPSLGQAGNFSGIGPLTCVPEPHGILLGLVALGGLVVARGWDGRKRSARTAHDSR